MRAAIRIIFSVVLTAAMALVFIYVVPRPGLGAGEPVPPGAVCHRRTVPVMLDPASTTRYSLVGWVCSKPGSKRRATIEVLVSGATYDHRYWNPARSPEKYSYVYAANRAGWSTFNIDRLGVGQSDKPPANLLTVQNEAYVVEQIIQRLRNGKIDGQKYKSVVAVGHSLGGGVLQYAAATATDPTTVPNALVVSDFLTVTNAAAIGRFASTLIPAGVDPAFTTEGLPEGYLTSQPGTRGASFYNTASADPAMIGYDESSKQTTTAAERSTLADARSSSTTHGVRVPTMIVVGQNDAFYCDAGAGLSCADRATVLAREAGNYSARACLQVEVVPGAGHVVDYHYRARDFFNSVDSWLRHDIQGAGKVDANGCRH